MASDIEISPLVSNKVSITSEGDQFHSFYTSISLSLSQTHTHTHSLTLPLYFSTHSFLFTRLSFSPAFFFSSLCLLLFNSDPQSNLCFTLPHTVILPLFLTLSISVPQSRSTTLSLSLSYSPLSFSSQAHSHSQSHSSLDCKTKDFFFVQLFLSKWLIIWHDYNSEPFLFENESVTFRYLIIGDNDIEVGRETKA